MRMQSAKLALMLALASILASCTTMTAGGETKVALCDQFRPIRWSSSDTDETIRTDAGRMDDMERKLDELIRLSLARESQISDLSEQVSRMAPTVQQVADAVTFAKVGRSVFRVLIGVGMVVAPAVWWLDGKWSLIAQLFKRVP